MQRATSYSLRSLCSGFVLLALKPQTCNREKVFSVICKLTELQHHAVKSQSFEQSEKLAKNKNTLQHNCAIKF